MRFRKRAKRMHEKHKNRIPRARHHRHSKPRRHTGCTKSLKRRPHRAKARRQEHSSSVGTEPRPPQEHSRSIETETTALPQHLEARSRDTSQIRVPRNSSDQTRIAPSSSEQKLQAEHEKSEMSTRGRPRPKIPTSRPDNQEKILIRPLDT